MVIHSSGLQISKQEIRAYVLQKRRTLLPEEKQRWDEALLERLMYQCLSSSLFQIQTLRFADGLL